MDVRDFLVYSADSFIRCEFSFLFRVRLKSYGVAMSK